MAIQNTKPNFDGAARSQPPGQFNVHLDYALRSMHASITALQQQVGAGAFDADKQLPVASAPAQASLKVVGSGGRFQVMITNPQFLNPQKGLRANPPNAPMIHHLRYADNPSFKNAVSLPPTTQNYFEFNHGSGTLYFELKSSLDGHTKNHPVLSGAVKA